MALIFQRLARNFIKNGYFPTDEATLARILNTLDIGGADVRVLDPCCGEGSALAEVKHHLTECGAAVQALGVEFDAERAWHAKGLLDTVAHSDVADVFVTARSVGLLFLNPPYGHTVADRAGTSERAKGDRLEKVFCRKTFPWLKLGGVLVLILPHYVLDAEFAELIARASAGCGCSWRRSSVSGSA
jgi:tRNA1(Val) A37 N6-methylase TrmN6